ncbi:Cu(I)-responsive transcriptional regulator [Acuticoccus sp. MNP-M23]|uniref:Cu(I)-responsive transcriptional regulator n=1 Tax=Acuticoccus sp. MNP-M23 TaxID=3072793 RepID=UPI002814EF1C|nr:Cu(I)-responsive transcriptional regulator [Acuticoccus sp. MNP-M23]WMS41967.1 Cu(I)-responsive transcriptional regulator [Acuticoccus sp. MNP-M23]
MNIGQASRESGVSSKMIRYYEEVGLTRKVERSAAGYRSYEASDVHTLHFIRQARDFGFSIEKIASLLALWRDRDRASADVKSMALAHVAQLEARISELQAMADQLKHLAENCSGDERPGCPIIERLAASDPAGDGMPVVPGGQLR